MIYLLLSIISQILKVIILGTGSYGSKTFPEPLSKEEEDLLIKEMLNGNKNARNKLIEHNLRLVAHIVKKYENSKEDVDDLISIGTIGLIKGIDTFSNKNGAKLTTYAARCVENATFTLWNYMKYSKQHLKHYKVEYKQLIA